jgi:hypothetical protein
MKRLIESKRYWECENRGLGTGYWVLVTGYWLLVTGD